MAIGWNDIFKAVVGKEKIIKQITPTTVNQEQYI
jgi:hypothetical protein